MVDINESAQGVCTSMYEGTGADGADGNLVIVGIRWSEGRWNGCTAGTGRGLYENSS